MMHDKVDDILTAMRAGFRRFYDEGHYVWSKKDLIAILQGTDLESPEVQSQFKRWEKTGAIRFLGEENAYLEVLNRIPD